MPGALITAVCNSLIRKYTHTPLYTQTEMRGYKLHAHTYLTGTHVRRMMKHSVICLSYGCVSDAFHVCVRPPSSKGCWCAALRSSYCSNALATSWKPVAVVLLRSHVTLLRGIKAAGNGVRPAPRGGKRRRGSVAF